MEKSLLLSFGLNNIKCKAFNKVAFDHLNEVKLVFKFKLVVIACVKLSDLRVKYRGISIGKCCPSKNTVELLGKVNSWVRQNKFTWGDVHFDETLFVVTGWYKNGMALQQL